MLALTEGAAEAIRQLTEVPAAEGVRISAGAAADGAQPGLRIELVAAPEQDDAVVEAGGAQLFLEQEAMQLLDDKVLDAGVEAGQVQFSVLEQAAGEGPADEPPAAS